MNSRKVPSAGRPNAVPSEVERFDVGAAAERFGSAGLPPPPKFQFAPPPISWVGFRGGSKSTLEIDGGGQIWYRAPAGPMPFQARSSCSMLGQPRSASAMAEAPSSPVLTYESCRSSVGFRF